MSVLTLPERQTPSYVEQILKRAEKNGQKLLENMDDDSKDEIICKMTEHFYIIEQSIPEEHLKEFYNVMTDILEFFSVDFNLILSVTHDCFHIGNERELECLLNAHYQYRKHHFVNLNNDERWNFSPYIQNFKSQDPPSKGIDLIGSVQVCVLCDILYRRLGEFQRLIIQSFENMARSPAVNIYTVVQERSIFVNECKTVKFIFEQVEILLSLFQKEKSINHIVENGEFFPAERSMMAYFMQNYSYIPRAMAAGQVLHSICHFYLHVNNTPNKTPAYQSFALAVAHMVIYKVLSVYTGVEYISNMNLHIQAVAELKHFIHSSSFSVGLGIETFWSVLPLVIYLMMYVLKDKKIGKKIFVVKKINYKSRWKQVAGELIRLQDIFFHVGTLGLLSYHQNQIIFYLTMINAGIKFIKILELTNRETYLRWHFRIDSLVGQIFIETSYFLELQRLGYTREQALTNPSDVIKKLEHFSEAIELTTEVGMLPNTTMQCIHSLQAVALRMLHYKEHKHEEFIRSNAELQMFPITPLCEQKMEKIRTFVNRPTAHTFNDRNWKLKISPKRLEKIIKLL